MPTSSSKFNFLALLQESIEKKDLITGRRLHSEIIRDGLDSIPILADHLIRLFGSLGSLLEANLCFSRATPPSVYTWHATIAAHDLHHEADRALELYHHMHQEGVTPDKFVFSCLLRACANTGAIEQGQLLHDQLVTYSYETDDAVTNSLVFLYAKCNNLREANWAFHKLSNPDVVSWSTIITGYAENGFDYLALELYQKMQRQGLEPDRVMFLCILKLCGNLGAISLGKVVHNQVISSRFKSDTAVGNALIDMYVKCGSIDEARKVFERLPCRDVVSWTAMILGFTDHGNGFSAVELFQKMTEEDIKADRVTFLCILKACGSIGAVWKGMAVHEQIIMLGFDSDVAAGSTVVDMYAKSGVLEAAYRVLHKLDTRNTVSWNAMIAGYADHGNCDMVVQCLELMQADGLQPTALTYSIILTACSHAGKVKEGYRHFVCMRKVYGIIPTCEHYLCMIDLLSRAGCLHEAKHLLETMPINKNQCDGWTSLLSACRKYGNVDVGRMSFSNVAQLEPGDGSCYMLMSNIYADAEMWGEHDTMHDVRKCRSAWKKPGQAWIEVQDKVHEFFVGDTFYPQMQEMLSKQDRLRRSMKWEGFIT